MGLGDAEKPPWAINPPHFILEFGPYPPCFLVEFYTSCINGKRNVCSKEENFTKLATLPIAD